ncbi:hypothetical protein BGZ57DRAFT_779237, partial [Hyaloscypha finlandica]
SSTPELAFLLNIPKGLLVFENKYEEHKYLKYRLVLVFYIFTKFSFTKGVTSYIILRDLVNLEYKSNSLRGLYFSLVTTNNLILINYTSKVVNSSKNQILNYKIYSARLDIGYITYSYSIYRRAFYTTSRKLDILT